MEKTNSALDQKQGNRNQQQSDSSQNDSRSRDTSQKGREEEVVNQQEQNRVTNAERGNETNRGTQITGSSGQDSQQGGQRSDAARSYSQGQGNNDNEDHDLGREDAEKTKRETPRM